MPIMWILVRLALVIGAILPAAVTADDAVENKSLKEIYQRNELRATPETLTTGTSLIAVLRSCDDLVGAEVTFHGIIVLASALDCPETKVVHVTDNTLIQSDGSVEMSNMHFIVYPGVNLLVHAKDVIRITRGKGTTRALLVAFGTTRLTADGWDESFTTADGDHGDIGGLVRTFPEKGGSVVAKTSICYSEDSMVVIGTNPAGKQVGSGNLLPSLVDDTRPPTTVVPKFPASSERENALDAHINTGSGNSVEKALLDPPSSSVTSLQTPVENPATTGASTADTAGRSGDTHERLSTVDLDPAVAAAEIKSDMNADATADAESEAGVAEMSDDLCHSSTTDLANPDAGENYEDGSCFNNTTGETQSPTATTAGHTADNNSGTLGGNSGGIRGFFRLPVFRKPNTDAGQAGEGIKGRAPSDAGEDAGTNAVSAPHGSTDVSCRRKGPGRRKGCDFLKKDTERNAKKSACDKDSHESSDGHSIVNLEGTTCDAPMRRSLRLPRRLPKLRVGEELTWKLETPDGRSVLSLSDDGSILFHKREFQIPEASSFCPAYSLAASRALNTAETQVAARDEGGSPYTATPPVVLISSKRCLLRRGLDVLRKILDRADKEREAGVGVPGWRKVTHNFSTKIDLILSALTVTQNMMKQRADRPVERAVLTLDDRGCLRVHVDSKCVLTKSGPRRWDWTNGFPRRRGKNEGYELYPSEDGLEVRLEGEFVWGLRREIQHEERVIWGVRAGDIMD